MNTTQTLLIFAVERPGMGEWARQQALNEAALVFPKALQGYGVYKNESETCFIVPWTEKAEKAVQELCQAYEQECYLYVDSRSQGLLKRPNGDYMCEVGKMSECSKEEAVKYENYTRIGDKFYVAI